MEIRKHINDTNASYRKVSAGDAKNTDLFLDNEHYPFFGSQNGDIKVRLHRVNLAQAVLFIASILPRKYDNSSRHFVVDYSTDFVINNLRLLDAFFTVDGVLCETKIVQWSVRKDVLKKNGQIDNRLYLNNLIDDVTYTKVNGENTDTKFLIRNYLAGGYSEIRFVRQENDDIYDFFIENAQTPFDSDEQNNANTRRQRQGVMNPSSHNGSLSSVILYGPPGTGKTFKLQREYWNNFVEDNRFLTTFHQAYSYEEFIEGLKPVLGNEDGELNYEIVKGIFYKACEQACIIAGYDSIRHCLADTVESRRAKFEEAIQNKRYVLFCIDEINRANVSAVFGDLISLIEDSKRLGAKYEMIASLPYSKERFGVPANLLLVGTMNTADRSIQLLDTALRRRFRFEEMLPDYNAIKNEKARKILKAINTRLRALRNKDNQIGHAYFCGIEADTAEEQHDLEIFKVMRDKIIPLLEEYFYNETDNIRMVLNDSNTVNGGKAFYVEDIEARRAYESLGLDEEQSFYELNSGLKDVGSDASAAAYINHIAE